MTYHWQHVLLDALSERPGWRMRARRLLGLKQGWGKSKIDPAIREGWLVRNQIYLLWLRTNGEEARKNYLLYIADLMKTKCLYSKTTGKRDIAWRLGRLYSKREEKERPIQLMVAK